jgi:8-amino-7-oxononanoate synthase
MNGRVLAELREALAAREADGLLRRIEPRRGLDFVTNDTLGMAGRGEVAESMARAAREAGAGARAARLLGGDDPNHRLAEERAARWLRAEAALLMPSGSQANAALLGSLLRPGDVVFSDERNHASLVDAIRLTKARKVVYPHKNIRALASQLAALRDAPRRVIVTDTVFSMTGGTAPLAAITALAEEFGAVVVADEAHAAGVLGPAGAGLAAELGLDTKILARVVTGGKALGVAGAFIAGPKLVIETVVNFGRAFLFTTAPPPAVAAGLAEAIELVSRDDAGREALRKNTARFRGILAEHGIEVAAQDTPILFLRIGDPERALAAAAELQSQGFDFRVVRPPTVPPGECGIRVVIHADHSPGDLDRAAAALAEAIRRAAPGPGAGAPRATAPPARHGLAVLGTDTNVGKTVVASMLVLLASERGAARYWKPVQSGSGADDDTAAVRVRLAAAPRASAANPTYAFAEAIAPHQAAAREGVEISIPKILDGFAAARDGLPSGGTLVMEGAGGLLVPLAEGASQDALVAALGVPVVLVARTSLGTINHTRLTLEALASRGIETVALVLVGDEHQENRATLERYVPRERVFHVPQLSSLDGPALAAAARASGLGRILDALDAAGGAG